MKKILTAVVSIIMLMSFTVVSYASTIGTVNSIWSGGYSCSNGAVITIVPSSTTPEKQMAIYRVYNGYKYVSATTLSILTIGIPSASGSGISATYTGWRKYSSVEDSSSGIYKTDGCFIEGKGYYNSSNNKKLVFNRLTYNYS